MWPQGAGKGRGTVYFQQAPRFCSLSSSSSEQAQSLLAYLVPTTCPHLHCDSHSSSASPGAPGWGAARLLACHEHVILEEKLTWQSSAGSSFSLTAQSGGQVKADQSNRSLFPPPCTAGPFFTSSKTGDLTVRWSFHIMCHKDQGIEKKGESGHLSYSCPTHSGPGKHGP